MIDGFNGSWGALEMVSNIGSWLIWLIPLFVSCGMAFGALIGLNLFSEAVLAEGPAGDTAGAAGALLVVITFAAGFVMSTVTIIAARVLHRNVPKRMMRRFGLGLMGGCATGVVAALLRNAAAAWLPLIIGPLLIGWFGGTEKRCDANE